jgi:putative transposase
MARAKSIPIRQALRKLFPAAFLVALARASGAVKRIRQVKPTDLFWVLVLGFGTGPDRSLAALRRAYEKATGHTIEESSFYDRFNDGLVKMFKSAVGHALEQSLGVGRALRGPLATFRDVLLTDSTVIRLHDLLAKEFPACRTNHTKAALKAHAIISVTGAGKQSIKVTGERAHDGPVFRVGQWVKERLLLFDLGYFRYQLFACIESNGGYFLTRLKANANPLIVSVNRLHRGRSVPIAGERLRDFIHRLQREILDVTVEVRFDRRSYAGRARRDRQRLRVVGIRDEASGQYHMYITNVPPEKLAAEDIRSTYALRWQVELLFKELKQHYRLDQMPSRKAAIVETLLYAAILTLVVSRRLLDAVRQQLKRFADRLPTQRWAALFSTVAFDLLLIATRPLREIEDLIKRTSIVLLHEAVDPNRKRPDLLVAVESRTHKYRARVA